MNKELFINYAKDISLYTKRANALADILDSNENFIDSMVGDFGSLLITSVNPDPSDALYEEFWNSIVVEDSMDWGNYYDRLRGEQ